MSLLVPYPRPSPTQLYANFSGRPATTWGTTLTGSTANTEGSNSQIVASTAYDAQGIWLSFKGMHTSATLTDGLVNIKIGASYEKTLIPNLICGWAANADIAGPRRYYFPVYIPRGTQIGGSLRSLIASDVVYVELELDPWTGERWCGAGVETLGAVTASSRGTAVTPGTTSEGTLTSIGTSTFAYKAVTLALAGNTDTTATAGYMAGDVGTSGAAIAGLENFRWDLSATEWVNPVDGDRPRYVEIAASTALYARLQSHTTDAEVKYVCIYGVY